MTRMTARKAICMAFGWDYAELSEYQPGWKRGPVKVYNAAAGDAEYVLALPAGKTVPSKLTEEFGEWKPLDTFAGWTVYGAAIQAGSRNDGLPTFMHGWTREQVRDFLKQPPTQPEE